MPRLNPVSGGGSTSASLSGAGQGLKDKSVFLVTGMGRSGTTFLAKILNHSSNATVLHEPFPGDKQAYAQACRDPRSAEKFLIDVRLPRMASIATEAGQPIYGEVNSILRRHAPALKRLLPASKIGLIVREGQSVVSSMLKRDTFTRKDLISDEFFLPQDYVSEDEWVQLPRFKKLCWYWRVENEYVLETVDFVIRFEDLLESYDYFHHQVVDRLGLEPIAEAIWQQARFKRENESRGLSFGSLGDPWNGEKRSYFNKVCGPLNNELGYP